MVQHEKLQVSMDEVRGLTLVAQRLFDPPHSTSPGLQDVMDVIEHLGAIQIDAIHVVKYSQYLVLWSRLGAYDDKLLDTLLHPEHLVFEYLIPAACILPTSGYKYYRPSMLRANANHQWGSIRSWMEGNEEGIQRVLELVRENGPLSSADFKVASRESLPENTHDRWNWYGNKEARRALQVLWTRGDIMVHSRHYGKRTYDLRERILPTTLSRDDQLPDRTEQLRYFLSQTIKALGIVTLAWLESYFPLSALFPSKKERREAIRQVTEKFVTEDTLIPVEVAGLDGPIYLDRDLLPCWERLHAGHQMRRTTLLSPFDNLIWDRAKTRALFSYDVSFEAYIQPDKRRYGYYCLSILHQGKLVGRVDPKVFVQEQRLSIQTLYLEPETPIDEDLIKGIAQALQELAIFVRATSISIEHVVPQTIEHKLKSFF